LLDLIKKEVGLVPSIECLDSLLSVCVISRDLNNADLVWKEYALLGYQPYIGDSYVRWACILYIVFSFFYNIFLLLIMLLYGCRMYHTILASGDHRSADIILDQIPSYCSHIVSALKGSFVKMDDV